MKRLLLSLFLTLGCAIGVFHANTASAAVPTCTDYRTLQPGIPQMYPNDGHLFVCFTTYDTQRVASIIDAGQRTTTADNSLMRNLGGMIKNSLYYYYFANRADAVSYMSSTAPYKSTPQFANSASRCGNTARSSVDMLGDYRLASEIYETCSYDHLAAPNKTGQNPNIAGTTEHESGHAFDFAWASQSGNPGIPVSTSKGFKTQYAGPDTGGPNARSDIFVLNEGNANTQMPSTCSLFGYQLPTLLEQDLGSPNSAVCNQSEQQLLYVGKTNSAIAATIDPYFFAGAQQTGGGPLYEELFAEEFATIYGSSGTTVPRADKVIPNLQCTLGVIYRLIGFQGTPGNPVKSPSAPCPAMQASDFTH